MLNLQPVLCWRAMGNIVSREKLHHKFRSFTKKDKLLHKKSKYSYVRCTPKNWQLAQGDLLEVIGVTDQCVIVRKLTVKKIKLHKSGSEYVPIELMKTVKKLEEEPWYFGNVTKRTQARKYLLGEQNGPGSFLVWKNAKNSFYYLSVKCDGIARHYKITEADKSFYLVECKKFLSISELVDSYSRDPDGLCEQLNKPCAKVEISPSSVRKEKEWEIERSSLEKVEKLDSGEFGEVWKGIWKNKTEVAIKEFQMRNKSILNEIEILKQLKHRRLLKLYGVCTMDDPISIVTELLNGSLSRFLRRCKSMNLSIEFSQLMKFAIQVAEGMVYLEAKKILHRDLRAENILIAESESCKIADFGLAQFTVSGESKIEMDARLPVKWMAPEVFTSQKYTVKCDVWSFGILLTEITTSGEEPYSDKSKASCVKAVRNGYRMPKPPDCPQSLYDIMLLCWNSNPLERPGFISLENKLSEVQRPTIPM